MKKATAWLLCIVLAATISSAAYAQDLIFEPGEYKRNAQNDMAFSYHALEMEHCIVAIGDLEWRAGDGDSDAAELLAEWIEEDAAMLWNAFSGAPLAKPTVYMTGITGRDGSFAVDNEAFISSEEFLLDEYHYLVALMQAMLGKQTPWLAEGCVTYALYKNDMDANPDGSRLPLLARAIDVDILTLLPTRFYSKLNSNVEQLAARLAAVSLVIDILAIDGPEALTRDVPAERMAQWRDRAGLPQDTNPEKTAALRQYDYTFGMTDDLTVTGEHLAYALSAGDAGLMDAAAVEDFIWRTCSAREALLAYLNGNASPDNAAYFAENLRWTEFKCREPQDHYASWFQYPDTVVLYDDEYATYVMAIRMLGLPQPPTVLMAGLSLYFDTQLAQSDLAELLRQHALEPGEEAYWSAGYQQYAAWEGIPTGENFDMRTWIDALAVTSEGKESGELDLLQCCSLMYYLVDEYGLDTVLDSVRLGQSEAEAFGKTFNMLQKEWRLFLRGKGGV